MRPREKWLSFGPHTLGDADLIALLLGTGSRGLGVEQLSATLLRQLSGLHGLAQLGTRELGAIPGVGTVRAIRLHAAIELGRRTLQRAQPHTEPILTPEQAYQHFMPTMTGLRQEECHVLMLDRRKRWLSYRVLTRGTDGFTIVDPKQIYRTALSEGASAMILAHNHPTGDPTPSNSDRELTKRVHHAGCILGIPLLDHLVIGATTFYSFAREGLLPRWEERDIGFLAEVPSVSAENMLWREYAPFSL